jgi:hypothetical protein
MAIVCGFDHPSRPSASRDSQRAVIGTCIRFHHFLGLQELRLTRARF